MFIKVEPAGFFMHTVKLVFDLDKPDSEDIEVRDYLAKYELEPRYRWNDKLDNDKAEVIQFGGCYLGNHLQEIGLIQRKAVEVELIIEAVTPYVEKVFKEVKSGQVSDRKCVTDQLAKMFHDESYFGSNESGELTVSLPSDAVLRSARLLFSNGC